MKNNRFESDILKSIRSQDNNQYLNDACKYATKYNEAVVNKRVVPSEENLTKLNDIVDVLDDNPKSNDAILKQLIHYGELGAVSQTGGRYFGFVNGGIIPSSLGAKWIADAWDQNAVMYVASPVSSKIEEVVEQWIKQLLGLSNEYCVGFVSGSSNATLCALAAGRNFIAKKSGYSVASSGLKNAPDIKVVIGEQAHSTVYKALSIIGLGSERVTKVKSDDEGRMTLENLPQLDENTLLILQAGNVNSGAFDEFDKIIPYAKEKGAYVHVDGAFGLWAMACSHMDNLTKSLELADSYTMDCHKTLNAPYDNGVVIAKDRENLLDTLKMSGSYIVKSEKRDPCAYTADMSRRSRGIELWATFKGLGKEGVNDLVYELHCKAKYMAKLLQQSNIEILNDVVFNQVVMYYKDNTKTNKLIKKIQESGDLWLGSSHWKGKDVARISVCSYRTTYEDIEFCAKRIIELSREI